MCQSIWLRPSNEMIESLGELRRLVGTENIVWQDDPVGPEGDDACLCPVDIPCTMVDNGYWVRRHEHDSMCYVCESVR